jgi:Xaa-Pro aminopeptidase
MAPPSLAEHVNTPIATSELERRWAAVRAAMAEAGLDVLVMQNNSDTVGGYVKYFTDLPASAYPTAVVFPREDLMSVAMHGPLNGERELPSEGDGVMRGVGRVFTTAAFPSAAYTRRYDSGSLLSALRPFAKGSIGLLGTAQMSLALGEHLRDELPEASFSEASELVDPIKAIKSPVEQELILRCAAVQDAAMETAFAAVEPGRRDSDVIAAVKRHCEELGAEAGVYMCGSAPVGVPGPILPPHLQHRMIADGDVVSILIECNGPGGMYTELGRACVLGKVPAPLVDELEFALEAQRYCVGLLQPGAAPSEVWDAYNTYMRENGRPEENRIHCHGQGYDLVERPLIRHDETLDLAVGMNFACHPSYVKDGAFNWICDNWMIGPDGPGERIHNFPQKIVELG